MGLIRSLVRGEDLEATLEVLDFDTVDDGIFAEESERGDHVLVEFPPPTQAVETVIEAVRDVVGEPETYAVIGRITADTGREVAAVERQTPERRGRTRGLGHRAPIDALSVGTWQNSAEPTSKAGVSPIRAPA